MKFKNFRRESHIFTQYKAYIFNENNSATIRSDYRALENYIKKKRILAESTDGTCPHYRLDTNFLPIFQTHHPNPLIKEYSWAQLRNKEIDDIRTIIRKEQINWLCCNCHEYLKDKYYNK